MVCVNLESVRHMVTPVYPFDAGVHVKLELTLHLINPGSPNMLDSSILHVYRTAPYFALSYCDRLP